jgi:hypothetical protein
LLAESQIFEDEALSGTKSRDNPAEEMPEWCDHGENLTGILCIDLIAKALILRVHKVLTNDSCTASLSWDTTGDASSTSM